MNDTKNSWENRQTEKQFGEKLDKATDCDTNKTGKGIDTIKNGVQNTAQRIGETGRKVGDSIKQGAEKVADKIDHAVDSTTDRLKGKSY